jgi:hypothetical protein
MLCPLRLGLAAVTAFAVLADQTSDESTSQSIVRLNVRVRVHVVLLSRLQSFAAQPPKLSGPKKPKARGIAATRALIFVNQVWRLVAAFSPPSMLRLPVCAGLQIAHSAVTLFAAKCIHHVHIGLSQTKLRRLHRERHKGLYVGAEARHMAWLGCTGEKHLD